MPKRAAKLTLISTGIVSGLLLILYLPVLIWSPPWGPHGYYSAYNAYDEISFIYFKDGYVEFGFNTKNRSPQFSTQMLKSKDDPSLWESEETTDIRISISQLICILGIDSEPDWTLNKAYNPFTVWHIKWLEWTN